MSARDTRNGAALGEMPGVASFLCVRATFYLSAGWALATTAAT